MTDVSTDSTPPPLAGHDIPNAITGSTAEIAEKSVAALNEQRARTGEAIEVERVVNRNAPWGRG
jgi:hypothetical protein